MTKTEPLVSICIPTYNRAHVLETAIASAVEQDYSNIEIIVLDNASPDTTPEVVKKHAALDKRIRYHQNAENIGANKNFNKAANMAHGEYMMWLADDDWIEPNYVSTCIRALLKDDSLCLVSGKPLFFQGKKVQTKGQRFDLVHSSPIVRLMFYYAQVGDNSLFYGVYKRAVSSQFILQNTIGADWFFIANIIFCGKAKMLEDTSIYRSCEGASLNLHSLANALGMPKLFIWQPYLGVAYGAYKDLLENQAAYIPLTKISRTGVGLVIFLGISLKKVVARNIYRAFLRVIGKFKVS